MVAQKRFSGSKPLGAKTAQAGFSQIPVELLSSNLGLGLGLGFAIIFVLSSYHILEFDHKVKYILYYFELNW